MQSTENEQQTAIEGQSDVLALNLLIPNPRQSASKSDQRGLFNVKTINTQEGVTKSVFIT